MAVCPSSIDLDQTLQQAFGFSHFREGQRPIIEALLRGENAAAVFPTGAGKSLCYQLPALLLDGVTLVVSPLLALMKDQVDALVGRGVAAARLDSSLSLEEYREVLNRARSGDLKLLYVAPERFNNERFRQSLKGIKVSLFAVDEAHCVSEWGHNFRPDYLKLAGYAEMCRAERSLALTATATPAVLEDIKSRFSVTTAVRTPFHRPNLELSSTVVGAKREKLKHLREALNNGPKGAAIVYVTLQQTAMEIASELCNFGFNAIPYHAGLDSERRVQTQELFLNSDDAIIVATIAFGMGIDKASIRAVYHYDPPKSLENYAQEIGRAGRDGERSVCHLFSCPDDRIPLENFVFGDTPTELAISGLVEELFSLGPELVINLSQLCDRHDVRPLVLRTMLTYLELDGYLEALTPVYSAYKFKPQISSKEILSKLEGQERSFLASVLKHSVKKRIWFTIDLEATRQSLGCRREEVVRALERCSDEGWLELQATQLRFRYRVLREPESLSELSADLYQRALRREQGELGRLNQVVELASSESCLPRRLAHHFGEELDQDCGTCGPCTGHTAQQAPAREDRPFDLGELPEELPDIRSAARFLCGITSPALRRAKLTRNVAFGRLRGIAFGRVLERLHDHFEGN